MTSLHPQSQYYLHDNGELIYKPHGGVDSSSPFVRGVWSAWSFQQSAFHFLKFLLQAKCLGASASEIRRLHDFNNLSIYIICAAFLLDLETHDEMVERQPERLQKRSQLATGDGGQNEPS